jgi:hypothetical protein
MTDLEGIKKAIVDTLRDEELASFACYEAEAYAKLWSSVFVINDWDVWNERKTALRLQVIRWLEDEDVPYTFHQFHRGCGLVGLNDQDVATHFELRWSGQTQGRPDARQEWNPHPVKSTFEPCYSAKP